MTVLQTLTLALTNVTHELAPAINVHTLAFNGQVPGPEICVQEGDFVRVKAKNKTELNYTVYLTLPR